MVEGLIWGVLVGLVVDKSYELMPGAILRKLIGASVKENVMSKTNGHMKHVRDASRRDSARVVIARLLTQEGFSISAAVRLLNTAGFRPLNSGKFSRQAVGVWWNRCLTRTDIKPFPPTS